MKTSIALLLCLLAGCESTRDFAKRHPVASGIGVALIAGSIAASASHSGGRNDPQTAALNVPTTPCTPQPNGSCR